MSLTVSSEFRGTHSKFSPSRPAFIKYTDEQFIQAFHNSYKSPIGTEMHFWAGVQINQRFTCSSLRDMAKSIKTLIFGRHHTDRWGLSEDGRLLLQEMKYVSKDTYNTLKAFVNDSIAEHMEEEMDLVFSKEFRGTADAVHYDANKKKLMIFDLKTGTGVSHMEQLELYAALYCLIKHIDPNTISFELRIYQNAEVVVFEPESGEIKYIADRIEHFDDLSRDLIEGGSV